MFVVNWRPRICRTIFALAKLAQTAPIGHVRLSCPTPAMTTQSQPAASPVHRSPSVSGGKNGPLRRDSEASRRISCGDAVVSRAVHQHLTMCAVPKLESSLHWEPLVQHTDKVHAVSVINVGFELVHWVSVLTNVPMFSFQYMVTKREARLRPLSLGLLQHLFDAPVTEVGEELTHLVG